MSKVLFLNPSKRGGKLRKARKSKKRKVARKLFANQVKKKKRGGLKLARKSSRKLRRNPIRLPKKAKPSTIIKEQLIPAGLGAVGAVLVSAANGMVIDRLPIPPQYKEGAFRDFLKGATAVAIVVAAAKATNNTNAKAVGVGAMTMVLADATRRAVLKYFPNAKLAGLESELYSPLGVWSGPMRIPSLAALAAPADDGMGYWTPGYPENAGDFGGSLAGWDPDSGQYVN